MNNLPIAKQGAERPIGVFDSGIGGLTVLKELIKTLPNESFIYLGDTARVPYGTRDKQTITQFALELANFLLKQKVKALVVACNTISATCLEEIKKISPVPVIGVIEPTVEYAVLNSRNKKIGVIGTRATVNSQIYNSRFSLFNKEIKVISQACPLFVPLTEEGLFESEATKIIAKSYLEVFNNNPVDTLILGCTHYPLLKNLIQDVVGKDVTLIDSATPAANTLSKILEETNLKSEGSQSKIKIFVTDNSSQTTKIIRLFLEPDIVFDFKRVDLYHSSSSSKKSSSDGLGDI